MFTLCLLYKTKNISLYGFIGVLQMHAIVEKLKALNTMYAFCVSRIER